MKKLLCFLLFLFPCTLFAQEKESFTVSPEYAKILENCGVIKRQAREERIINIGEMRIGHDDTVRNLFRKRKLRIHATNTLHYREELSFRAKRYLDGYFVGLGYETNRDPIKLLFEPIARPFFDTTLYQ